MNRKPIIFAVDDDHSVLSALCAALGHESFDIRAFLSPSECLEQLRSHTPDLLFADVNMPEMDGYALVGQALQICPGLPAIFLSANESIEFKIKALQAGALDYIVKPFEPTLLLHAVARFFDNQTLSAANSELSSALADQETLSDLVMANMDEYAVLVQFLRALVPAKTYLEAANACLAMMRAYGLDGVCMAGRGPDALTLSARGADIPMEKAALVHAKALESVFSIGKCSAYNYPSCAMMVKNMPADPEKAGRLRDHLAIACESASSKIDAIDNENALSQNKIACSALSLKAKNLAKELHKRSLAEMDKADLLMADVAHNLANAFVSMGLTEIQEAELAALSRETIEAAAALIMGTEDARRAIEEIASELDQVSGPAR